MKKYSYILILLCLISCKQSIKKKNNCIYTINNLLKDYDSTRFKIVKFENGIDVLDSVNDLKERGIYKFDGSNRLRFYAYLLDDSNNFHFSIEYDSLGNIINKTGGEVVRWYFERLNKDTIEITFFFYNINFSYSNISLKIGNEDIRIAGVSPSLVFSHLVGNKWKMPFQNNSNKKTIYIAGRKKNLCSNDTTIFEDSVYIPELK